MSYDAYTYYQTHSAMTESVYPYTAVDGTCQYDEAKSSGVRTQEPGHITVPYDDVNQMKEALSK